MKIVTQVVKVIVPDEMSDEEALNLAAAILETIDTDEIDAATVAVVDGPPNVELMEFRKAPVLPNKEDWYEYDNDMGCLVPTEEYEHWSDDSYLWQAEAAAMVRNEMEMPCGEQIHETMRTNSHYTECPACHDKL